MTLAPCSDDYDDGDCAHVSTRFPKHARQTWALGLPTPWHLGTAVALIASMLVFGIVHQTKAEELGHRLHHENDYRHWKQPGTDISCCSDHDCAPVTAELREGQWFALRQSEWFAAPDEMDESHWLPLRRSEWIAIPDAKIIWERNPTIEGGNLCYSSGRVICFVPPNTGG